MANTASYRVVPSIVALLWLTGPLGAVPIQDNSFLLEEAYNQEPGVIQHIQSFQRLDTKHWQYTFTQEWPVPGETHQASYTIPVLHDHEDPPVTGTGDVALNYRYQLISGKKLAAAPRLSILLPTGDSHRGLGSGVVGWQTNQPWSIQWNEFWVTHANLGGTVFPRASSSDGSRRTTWSYNYGASLIWLLHPKFNALMEVAGARNQTPEPGGGLEREETLFLNPGVRAAFDFSSGLQIVPGISAPIGVGPSSEEQGFLLYLSFEHPLF